MKLLSFLVIFFNIINIFSSDKYFLSIYIWGSWDPETLFCSVQLERKDYGNFDNLCTAIVDYYNKSGKKNILNGFLEDVKEYGTFWNGRYNSIKNLKEFLGDKVDLKTFLQDKAVIDFEKTNVGGISKKDFSFDLSNIACASITIVNSYNGTLKIKDLYQMKSEFKDKNETLIKYINENRLSDRLYRWLSMHELGDIFYIDHDSNSIKIGDEYKDLTIEKPDDYKDIVIKNGRISDINNDEEEKGDSETSKGKKKDNSNKKLCDCCRCCL